MAAQRGMGALGFQFVSADAANAWVHAYYNNFINNQQLLADYATNPNIALVSYFMCAETDEEARRRADGITFFQFCLRYYRPSDGGGPSGERAPPGTVDLWDEYNKWKRENPEQAKNALTGGLIGSPETIRRKLHKFKQSHVDQIILLNQAGDNSHEHICESLELFAKEVMPEFHALEPEHQAWKKGVLDRSIALEELDTSQHKTRFGGKSIKIEKPKVAAE
jgi:alkanesulfonate monooxygenase SsuD/methylene tetrahydromethanopterin reductase-like flavin-dependent oxidoreductase (luciferase family)